MNLGLKRIKGNEGVLDRTARVIVGAALLFTALTVPNAAWAYIGIIPFVTGLAGWCPLYTLLGINTCGKNKTC